MRRLLLVFPCPLYNVWVGGADGVVHLGKCLYFFLIVDLIIVKALPVASCLVWGRSAALGPWFNAVLWCGPIRRVCTSVSVCSVPVRSCFWWQCWSWWLPGCRSSYRGSLGATLSSSQFRGPSLASSISLLRSSGVSSMPAQCGPGVGHNSSSLEAWSGPA